MKVSELEEALLAACLSPGAQASVMAESAARLSEERFSLENRDVYSAMLTLYYQGTGIDLITVANALGSDLERVGGMARLRYLQRSLERLDVKADGFEDWVKLVNSAGQVRQVSSFLRGYTRKLDDIDRAVAEIRDVEQFVSEFQTGLQGCLGGMIGGGGYRHIGDVVEDWKSVIERKLNGIVVDRFPTGWPSLDKEFQGFPLPGLVILAGLPATGKTQLAAQIAMSAARAIRDSGQTGCVAFNSIEMTASKLVERMACAGLGLDSRNINSALAASDASRLFGMADDLATLPFYIDPSDYVTSDMIRFRAASLHMQQGPLRLMVVDFAELISDENLDSEERRVSGIYRAAASVAKQLGITFILLAQYNRKVANRASLMGTDHELRYSSLAGIVANQTLHIYNPVQLRRNGLHPVVPAEFQGDSKTAWVICAKNRDSTTGNVALRWEPGGTFWSDPLVPKYEQGEF